MNWPVVIVTGIALAALVMFLIRRNMKDKKEVEEQLKNDYHKPRDEEGDVDADNALK